MARGFLSGALLGGVVSLGVGGVASVIAPLNEPVQTVPPLVSDTAPRRGETPQSDDAALSSEGGVMAEASGGGAPVATRPALQAVAPAPDSLKGLAETASPAAKAPVTGDAAELAAPADVNQIGAVDLSREDPVIPNPQALAPMLPQDSDAVAIDTAPAAPPATKKVASAAVSDETAEEIVAEALAKAQRAVPQPETGVARPTETVTAENATENTVADDAAVVAPQAPGLEAAPQTVQTETAPVDPPVNAAPEEDEAGDSRDGSPQVARLAPTGRPQIGTPAVSLTERNTGVIVNRLGNAAPDASIADATIRTDASAGGDVRPIRQYAQPFENAEDKPLMGIVLIDDGRDPTSGAPGLAALRSFPYPLSFAVDSSLPDAAERIALYREEGFEVLAMVDLPQGAQASDVETTLATTLSKKHEVVGLLEGTGEGLQGSREVADQVTAILAQSGHGLVTRDKGLNTMPKLARKAGVPADPVFRDFDSEGQTATVIRRFLDQAAFKAGQEGAVVMLGRLRPDTISALLLWGLQDRAGKVALAPISAVLMRDDG
ncbi:MAG: divergent polysaccharide deacetylase family protein [Sulfitobacter sp.]